MRDKDRKLMRRRLDVEMRPFRRAGKDKNATSGLLRAVRHALRVPALEIAEGMGIGRSVVFDIELREERGGVTLATISRTAEAMGCRLVYGIVPLDGLTMEALWEKRLWAGLLGVPMLNKTEREEMVGAFVEAASDQ